MREIKFRAWFPKSRFMLHFCEPHINHEYGLMAMEVEEEDFRGIANLPNDYDEVTSYMQFTGLHDKNGKEIWEGDIVGKEGVYHFIERDGWKPSSGKWKIIGEKTENFTGKGDEKYIAGYELKVVEWKDRSCGFEPFSDSEENCGHCGGGEDSRRFEVIGNIYESKNLLDNTDIKE